jgi:hypothetical protein
MGPQAPATQVRPVPHEVRSATLPLALHACTPLASQVVEYVRQASGVPGGVQVTPATQGPAPHTPPVHTFPPPQDAPSARLVPVSAQAGVPLQVVVPVWQGFAGAHVVPGAHAAPTNPALKCVTVVVAMDPLTVTGRTSHSVVPPGFVQ